MAACHGLICSRTVSRLYHTFVCGTRYKLVFLFSNHHRWNILCIDTLSHPTSWSGLHVQCTWRPRSFIWEWEGCSNRGQNSPANIFQKFLLMLLDNTLPQSAAGATYFCLKLVGSINLVCPKSSRATGFGFYFIGGVFCFFFTTTKQTEKYSTKWHT